MRPYVRAQGEIGLPGPPGPKGERVRFLVSSSCATHTLSVHYIIPQLLQYKSLAIKDILFVLLSLDRDTMDFQVHGDHQETKDLL